MAKKKTKSKSKTSKVVKPALVRHELTDDQKQALEAMEKFKKSKEREFVLDGVGGTGKTFILQRVFERKKKDVDEYYIPSTVLGIAVTHQAVLNLKKYIPNVKTYASAANLMMDYDLQGNLYFMPRTNTSDYGEMYKYKDIIVDECSQFSEEMIAVLKESIDPKARIRWVGDHHQLPPIGLTGEDDSPVFSLKNHYTLTEKFRQKEGDHIAELCDFICERIDTDHDLTFISNLKAKYDTSNNKGYAVTSLNNAIESFVRNFKNGMDVRITSYRNKRIQLINDIVRTQLWDDDSNSKFVPGDFIVLNDQYAPDMFPVAYNGQTFTIKEVFERQVEFVDCYVLDVGKGITLPVPTEKGYMNYKNHLNQLKAVAIKTREWGKYQQFKNLFANVSYGYAVSNYKIQGATIKGCYVDLSDILSVKPINDKRKLQAFYVGCSRPTDLLAIF